MNAPAAPGTPASPDSPAATERPSSSLAVVVAFVANVLVAIAKSAAAALTGSASMLAEAAHSWADAGNEIFLIVADRKAARPRDAAHPLGYGRESYVWSLFAAVGLFTAGAVVSVTHGVQELLEPEPASDFAIAYVVLAVAFVLEGASFAQSLVQIRRDARRLGRPAVDLALNGSNSTLRAVLAEDAAALIGLVLAATGILLHQVTGSAVYDAIGSILIGVLLGVVAIVLIGRNRRFLVGVVPPSDVRQRAGRALLALPDVDRVTYLHLEFIGPERLSLVAAVDLAGDDPESGVALRLRTLERSIEEIPAIGSAVLTLSVRDEPSLDF
ncbi:cation diffusion facilitator family transporter [Labedella gwakjiensis]|uniref:Cation diffusion facilitator family transporter n=1 Tax=Labedella gwakjiensis TaxID=390269 RepID=A0A2P8GZ79_9MICO|nr:cation diffusion facilitator family transporter [Labedella gwakjiensis]PSL39272.1 cation diffusion facilitator family transporter [Labedella gwakjiensis]RUQ86305.1 cation diffusion facilitator family transporter [Labedella gwakjiensis]